eukprot:1766423-Amphidinium_carterae.2
MLLAYRADSAGDSGFDTLQTSSEVTPHTRALKPSNTRARIRFDQAKEFLKKGGHLHSSLWSGVRCFHR